MERNVRNFFMSSFQNMLSFESVQKILCYNAVNAGQLTRKTHRKMKHKVQKKRRSSLCQNYFWTIVVYTQVFIHPVYRSLVAGFYYARKKCRIETLLRGNAYLHILCMGISNWTPARIDELKIGPNFFCSYPACACENTNKFKFQE